MLRRSFPLFIALAGLGLVALCADAALAQGGGGRGGRGFGGRRGLTHQVAIAAAPEVQADLKLTDDQKTKVADLNTKYNEARQALGGGGGGGGGGGQSPEAIEARNKLNAEYATMINDALEKPQAARLQEIYVQVNGTGVLADEAIIALLKLTDDQKEKLNTVRQENGQKTREALQGAGDLSREEQAAKMAELTKAADEAILGALTEEQRKAFEDLKGKKLEIDMTQFQGRGGRGGGAGGGGRNRPANGT